MAANSRLLRPFGIAAGVLGSFQAIGWGVLSLLGILFYTQDIYVPSANIKSHTFGNVFIAIYFVPTATGLSHMTPAAVAVWMSLYFATSVIWLVLSSFLIYDSHKSKFTSKLIVGWVTVSAVIAVIDFAAAVTFGVDYYKLQGEIDNVETTLESRTYALLTPILMMTLCARGFILWITNVVFVIYLGVAARKLDRITV